MPPRKKAPAKGKAAAKAKATTTPAKAKAAAKDTAETAATEATTSSAAAPSTATTSVWGKAAGAWNCSECYSENAADVKRCAACEAPKDSTTATATATPTAAKGAEKAAPKAAAAPAAAAIPVSNVWGKAAGAWNCSECYSENSAEATRCAACEAPKGGAAAETASAEPAKQASGFKFGPGAAATTTGTAPAAGGSGEAVRATAGRFGFAEWCLFVHAVCFVLFSVLPFFLSFLPFYSFSFHLSFLFICFSCAENFTPPGMYW